MFMRKLTFELMDDDIDLIRAVRVVEPDLAVALDLNLHNRLRLELTPLLAKNFNRKTLILLNVVDFLVCVVVNHKLKL